ncbi:unnamed protein product, partial [Iphiclides podalirius]
MAVPTLNLPAFTTRALAKSYDNVVMTQIQNVSELSSTSEDKKILPMECKETADLLLFFDNLFDSVNGSFGRRGSHGKPLLGPVKPHSAHHQIWAEAKTSLRNMKFIGIDGRTESVPTLNNWNKPPPP